MNVLKTVLSGVDNSNAFLKQNIPSLLEDVSINKDELKAINETLPKHAEKLKEIQKNITNLNEAFSNEDEKMANLNKLVTNLFGQVYDMTDQQNEVSKAMSKVTEEQTKLA